MEAQKEASPALRPVVLGRLRLANRIVLSPMTRMQAGADGVPTPAMAAYYARYAANEVGLVMTEAAYTDEAQSRAYFGQPGMANDRQADGWKRVVDAVHREGRPVLLQLQHGGRLAEVGLHACALGASGERAAGLSWQRGAPYAGGPVRRASDAELAAVVRGFHDAAARARRAGFDGIEIHGARGYFVDELLSRPGLPLEARLRIPLAIASAAREAFPEGTLSWNFSLYKMDDLAYQPPSGRSEVEAILHALAGAGMDILHITTRRVLRAEAFGAPVASVARAALPGHPLIVNGGVRTLSEAEEVLSRTGAECVALARALLANPDWIARSREGRELKPYVAGQERERLIPSAG